MSAVAAQMSRSSSAQSLSELPLVKANARNQAEQSKSPVRGALAPIQTTSIFQAARNFQQKYFSAECKPMTYTMLGLAALCSAPLAIVSAIVTDVNRIIQMQPYLPKSVKHVAETAKNVAVYTLASLMMVLPYSALLASEASAQQSLASKKERLSQGANAQKQEQPLKGFVDNWVSMHKDLVTYLGGALWDTKRMAFRSPVVQQEAQQQAANDSNSLPLEPWLHQQSPGLVQRRAITAA